MRVISTILTLSLAGAATLVAESSPGGIGDRAKIAAYTKSLPTVTPHEYSEKVRLAFAANPLGCEEHLQGKRYADYPGSDYLWHRDGKAEVANDYEHHLAFYGCSDWHSAMNSSWMMVALIKSDPTIATGQQIRDDFERRFQKPNIDGEIDYLRHLTGTGADFEKPYGYTWMLKLYGELKSWDDPEGRRTAAVLDPMATWFAKAFAVYLKSLNYPVRLGMHPNTALNMGFALDYTVHTHDTELEAAIRETAMRLFANDKDCPTAAEPVFGEFDSPCLLEAMLMGRVMPPAAFAKWLDDFLPPVYSEEFAVYGKQVDGLHGDNRDTTGTEDEGVWDSLMIGLNFRRAIELTWISRSLPPDDPRIPAYKKLIAIDAKQGYDNIGLGGYAGTHWLATYALMYETLREQK